MFFVFPYFFRRPITFLILVGVISGHVGIKMMSGSTPSANEQAKYLILVYTVQLKLIIKAHFSAGIVFSINDVVIASVHSEKVHLKNFVKIIIIIILVNEKRK